MDYSAGFVTYLVKAMHNARTDIGTDIMAGDHSQYLQFLELLAIDAMLMKAIQDLHPDAATDAAWAQRLNISLDTGPNGARNWPGWVVLQVPPERLAKYGATEADSVPVLQAKIDAWNAAQ
jgi:hypothetical protein